jgi:hypothetical protein
MSKFIRCLSGELLNISHIIAFNLAVGEGVDEKNKRTMVTMYGVIGTDIAENNHELGLYDTEEQAEKMLDLVVDFLNNNLMAVFDMPGEW